METDDSLIGNACLSSQKIWAWGGRGEDVSAFVLRCKTWRALVTSCHDETDWVILFVSSPVGKPLLVATWPGAGHPDMLMKATWAGGNEKVVRVKHVSINQTGNQARQKVYEKHIEGHTLPYLPFKSRRWALASWHIDF